MNITRYERVILKKKNGKNAILTAFYGIKWYPRVAASLKSLSEFMPVRCQRYQSRVTIFVTLKSDKMVKNAIFTAFYGILRHFLVKIPTDFFVLCMVTFVHMYITALHGSLCWGIFKKLPQLRRGVKSPQILPWKMQENIKSQVLVSLTDKNESTVPRYSPWQMRKVKIPLSNRMVYRHIWM